MTFNEIFEAKHDGYLVHPATKDPKSDSVGSVDAADVVASFVKKNSSMMPSLGESTKWEFWSFDSAAFRSGDRRIACYTLAFHNVEGEISCTKV